MIKKFLFASLLLTVLPVYASHIVGGEFELIHLSGYTYRLNLIYYFDVINNQFEDNQGNHIPPEVLEPTLTVYFFQKSNNAFIDSLTLPFQSKVRVSYTQPDCSSGEIVTDKLVYSSIIELSPSIYNSPEGYYVSWQRCCRNYTITNIYSDPIGKGTYAGQTFYLEFPPVIKDGSPFVNSSPHLFPPLNDYACPGRPYYVNFAGVDDDGDSIAYSLTTPLNIKKGESLPGALPGPYPLVKYRPGFDSLHIIGGSPDLSISHDGILTCTPINPGLFVFAVKAEEFRDGIKIGEARRDFQMLVVSGCQPDQPPQISGRKLTETDFTYTESMSVDFADTVLNNHRCVMVRVADPDSNDPIQNFTEKVSIKAIALNSHTNVSSVLPSVTTAVLSHGSTKDFMICFELCPYPKSPYQIGIVAFDDACSLPLSDTLKITVNEEKRPNTNAYFLPPKSIAATLNEGESGSWLFKARDDDGDKLVLSIVTNEFALEDAGMAIKILNQQPGSINGSLDWSAICKKFEFSKKTDFLVKVLVDDQDACNVVHFDTVLFDLKVLMPYFDPHLKIFNNANGEPVNSSTIVMNLGHLELNLVGTDTNPSLLDTLNLSLIGIDGTLQNGYSFSDATGLHQVESKFLWDFNCSIFKANKDTANLKINFLVANNHCKTPFSDKAFVNVIVSDIKSVDKDFAPANVITTYPDHCNDFFAIDGFESEPDCNGQERNVPLAPIDNCSNRFERVKIYDRWGKQVFESNDRFFRWYASSESAGVYYYIIYFSNHQYKSSLTVIH